MMKKLIPIGILAAFFSLSAFGEKAAVHKITLKFDSSATTLADGSSFTIDYKCVDFNLSRIGPQSAVQAKEVKKDSFVDMENIPETDDDQIVYTYHLGATPSNVCKGASANEAGKYELRDNNGRFTLAGDKTVNFPADFVLRPTPATKN